MNCGRMQNFWEIHRESDLAADPRALNIFAPEHAEIESHAIANCVLTANQSLELASAQIAVIGKASVDLGYALFAAANCFLQVQQGFEFFCSRSHSKESLFD